MVDFVRNLLSPSINLKPLQLWGMVAFLFIKKNEAINLNLEMMNNYNHRNINVSTLYVR